MAFSVEFLAAAALLCSAGSAEAVCTPRAAPDIENPKAYVSALVDSLVVLKSARDRSNELKSAASPMDVIAVLETARQEYDCAISYVAPYEKSSKHAIAASAQALSVATASLEAISETMRQTFKDLLDGKTEKPSEHAERAGRLEVQGRDAWHFEMNSVVAACISLVEFGPDQKQRGILLTTAERGDLLVRVRKNFGNPSSKDERLPPLESSAIVLRDFLADDKTRPSH
jgi:hypothetical protein